MCPYFLHLFPKEQEQQQLWLDLNLKWRCCINRPGSRWTRYRRNRPNRSPLHMSQFPCPRPSSFEFVFKFVFVLEYCLLLEHHDAGKKATAITPYIGVNLFSSGTFSTLLFNCGICIFIYINFCNCVCICICIFIVAPQCKQKSHSDLPSGTFSKLLFDYCICIFIHINFVIVYVFVLVFIL